MIIFPAIDIKDGRCVRLVKGDFSTAHQVAEDPLGTAAAFRKAGAEWLHMVDLDGAKDARPRNAGIFLEIAAQSGLKVELGGGIRTMAAIQSYLEGGVARVILGSAALRDPALVREAAAEYGPRIAVGIDAREEMAAAEGWLDVSRVHYLELAKAVEQAGVGCIIYTDIGRDGTLSGPNLEQLARLRETVGCDVTASGGIRDLEDIRALKAMGLYGAICGKSLYQGTLKLGEALALCREEE